MQLLHRILNPLFYFSAASPEGANQLVVPAYQPNQLKWTLGVKKVFFLNHNDGELEPTLKLREEIVKVIRETKPTLVITMDPTMRYSEKMGYINHPDHIAAAEATLAAVFPLARDRLAFPNHEKLGIRPHTVREVLLVHFDEPNFYVDIGKTIDKKVKALKCHQSQVGDIFPEIDKMVRQWATSAGKKIGVKYAEGFKRIVLSF